MSGEEGGWLWLMIDVVFVVIFAAAMAYGLMAWRKRRNVGGRSGGAMKQPSDFTTKARRKQKRTLCVAARPSTE